MVVENTHSNNREDRTLLAHAGVIASDLALIMLTLKAGSVLREDEKAELLAFPSKIENNSKLKALTLSVLQPFNLSMGDLLHKLEISADSVDSDKDMLNQIFRKISHRASVILTTTGEDNNLY